MEQMRELILKLMSAHVGSRQLDFEIASALGWTKRLEPMAKSPPGHDQWQMPEGSNVEAKVPCYTTSVQAAYQLTEQILPGNTGGCAWHDGGGSAQINGWPAIESSTPELALCIAALRIKAALDLKARSDGHP